MLSPRFKSRSTIFTALLVTLTTVHAVSSSQSLAVEPLKVFVVNSQHIHGLAFSPNGENLAAVGWDAWPKTQWLREWDAKTFDKKREASGDYWSLVYRHDSRMLVAGTRKGLAFWSVTEEKPQSLPGGKGTIMALGASPAELRFAWGNGKGMIHLLAGPGNPPLELWGHRGSVAAIAFAPDGKLLASAGRDATVMVWDARSGRRVATFKGHTQRCTSIAFSADGRRVASGSVDKTVRVWDLEKHEQVAVLSDHHDQVQSVAYSPDGKYLVSGAFDSDIRIWDAKSSKLLKMLSHHRGSVDRLAFSPDSRLLASGSQDRTIRVWEMTHVVAEEEPLKVAETSFKQKKAKVPDSQRDWDSPASVFATRQKAMAADDWALELECFAPAMRGKLLGTVILHHSHLAFSLENIDQSKIGDEELYGRYMHWTRSFKACLKKHGVEPDKVSTFAIALGGKDAVPKILDYVNRSVKDPTACFVELNELFTATFPEQAETVRKAKLGSGDAVLKDISIDGREAEGTLVQERDGKSKESPMRFERVGDKWFIGELAQK